MNKEHFALNDYKSYGVLSETWKPIDYINISVLTIRDKFDKNEIAIINREYHDGYLTIISIQHYYKNEPYRLDKQIISHTPEEIKLLVEESKKVNNEVDKLLNLLKTRGHINIISKSKYQEVNFDTYECEFLTQIDTEFPISNEVSFKDGREIVKKESDFFKKYRPEVWGCFQYKDDIVFKNFRFLFNEKTGKPTRLSDFE